MQVTFYVLGRIAERVEIHFIPRVGDKVWLPEGYFIVQQVAHDFRRETTNLVHIWLIEEKVKE